MRDRKNTKQEKNKESGKILDKMEGIYSGRGHLGEERKFEKCRRIN